MRRWTTRLGWLLLCCCASVTAQEPSEVPLTGEASRALFESDENYALVIGVDRYDHPNVNRLDYAVTDAERLAAQLTAQGYTVQLVRDYEANPGNVLDRIRRLGEVITDGGRESRGNLVFAFSGHGFRIDDENYLATSRTDPADLKGTALSMERLTGALRDTGIRQQVLFIDACRNDPTKGAADPNARFALDEEADGLAILYSTGADSLSWEDSKLGQGVFSYFLSEGLAGAREAVDLRGYIAFDRLARFVQRRVRDYALLEFDATQIPYVAGERTGEFVLGSADRAVTSEPVSISNEIVPDGNGPIAEQPVGGRRGWIVAGTVLGVIALGVLASSAGGSSGGEPGGEGSVTLLVPTP